MKAAVLVAVPPGVVTTTSFAPAAPAGATPLIEVALFTTTLVAAMPPTFTLVAPVRLSPVILKGVPPSVDPALGEMDAMVGAGVL